MGRVRFDQDQEPTLNAAEERDLARRMEAGVLAKAALASGSGAFGATTTELMLIEEEGIRARHRFISANLPLVSIVLRQLAPPSRFPEPDLFQEGCVGLAIAVMRFDHLRGIRFATYGLYWIRAYVGAAAAGQLGALNLPTNRAEQLRTARHRQAELAQVLGRIPTIAELARALGRDMQWTSDLVGYRRPRPLDAFDADLVAGSDEQLATDEDSVDGAMSGADLLRRLDDLGRRVLEHRFGFADGAPHSYAETARSLGLTPSRARRIEHRALDQLRRICPHNALVRLQ